MLKHLESRILPQNPSKTSLNKAGFTAYLKVDKYRPTVSIENFMKEQLTQTEHCIEVFLPLGISIHKHLIRSWFLCHN